MNLTDEQLQEFSKNHLCYEIDSLYSALELFAHHPKVEIKSLDDSLLMAQANLLLEGTIIHSRCLYEFLYRDNSKKPDDALAIHYFRNPQDWTSIRPTHSVELAELSYRTGKQVAHLTYTRQTSDQIQNHWNLFDITNDLLSTLILFANNADKKKLHANVPRHIQFWTEKTSYEPGQTPSNFTSSDLLHGAKGATTPINLKPT